MRILFLNNYYYLRGGSERVFFDDISLLESNGHTIVPFSRMHPDNIETPYSKYFPSDLQTEKVTASVQGIRTVSEIVSSKECVVALKKLLDDFTPDVVHAHNIYGRLTTSVLNLLKQRNIPVVMTLHDYKLICPSYKMEVNGRVCEQCQGRNFYRAIVNRCLKDSYIASSVYAFEAYFNRFLSRYRDGIDMLISPSQFLKDKMVEYGWQEQKIQVVRNTLELDKYKPSYEPGDYFLYLGRLSREKGISTLLKAFFSVTGNVELVIAGSGPLESALKTEAAGNERVHFVGHLNGEKLAETIAKARAIVVPSEWYENAPMSVLEAMAYGKPVIGANIGGIPELIDDGKNGVLFESGNEQELSDKLQMMIDIPDLNIKEMGKAARECVRENHSFGGHYIQLMELYNSILSNLKQS